MQALSNIPQARQVFCGIVFEIKIRHVATSTREDSLYSVAGQSPLTQFPIRDKLNQAMDCLWVK